MQYLLPGCRYAALPCRFLPSMPSCFDDMRSHGRGLPALSLGQSMVIGQLGP